VDEGRAMDVVYLDVSKVFYTAAHQILADELMKYGLDKWTARWTENWVELSSSEGCRYWHEAHLQGNPLAKEYSRVWSLNHTFKCLH